jgi:hypothetical protein
LRPCLKTKATKTQRMLNWEGGEEERKREKRDERRGEEGKND